LDKTGVGAVFAAVPPVALVPYQFKLLLGLVFAVKGVAVELVHKASGVTTGFAGFGLITMFIGFITEQLSALVALM
jgi:hypothetical protein